MCIVPILHNAELAISCLGNTLTHQRRNRQQNSAKVFSTQPNITIIILPLQHSSIECSSFLPFLRCVKPSIRNCSVNRGCSAIRLYSVLYYSPSTVLLWHWNSPIESKALPTWYGQSSHQYLRTLKKSTEKVDRKLKSTNTKQSFWRFGINAVSSIRGGHAP